MSAKIDDLYFKRVKLFSLAKKGFFEIVKIVFHQAFRSGDIHAHTHFQFGEDKENSSCVVSLEQLRNDIDFLWDGLVTEESGTEISILHHGQSGLLVLL